jgi:hypothetical protein
MSDFFVHSFGYFLFTTFCLATCFASLRFFSRSAVRSPSLRFSFTGAQFLPGLGRGFGSWKDRVCLIQMGLRLAPIGTFHSLTRALDHMLQDLLNALDGLGVVWLQGEDRPILLEGVIILGTGEATGLHVLARSGQESVYLLLLRRC